jgi:hypothetical protein
MREDEGAASHGLGDGLVEIPLEGDDGNLVHTFHAWPVEDNDDNMDEGQFLDRDVGAP